MICRTYIPQPPLSQFVDCFWFYDGYVQPHAKERLLPDGSTGLVVNLREDNTRIYDREDHNRVHNLSGSVICGPHSESFVIDAVYKRALQAGGASLAEPVNQPYGDREAAVKDRFGNHWFIATHQEKGKHIPDGLRSVTLYLHPRGTAKLIDFLRQAFAATEDFREQSPDGTVQHAKIRIGDSVMEMGEAHGEFTPMPAMIYLYVNDVDAVYKRALGAGATSLAEPADQPYGDRVGAVTDPFGNMWYLGTHIADVAT